MDEATRLEYLKVMGVECWHVREMLEPNTETIELNQMETETETEIKTISTPDNWEQLKQDVQGCQQCALCQTRTQTVFGEGNPQADWLFIGEAPGAHEDLQGKPFVGMAGFLLTEMIRAMGLTRERIFITNLLKCRPPDNRDPKKIEMSTCYTYLNRQKALIAPKIIVAIGRMAAQKLLNTDEPLSKLRGVVHQLDNIPLIVVYHPAYLLRRLSQKKMAWQDLQFALRTYQQLQKP